MLDDIQIIQRLAAGEAQVKALDKPYLDLTSTMGQGILAFLGALAQDERERIVKRTQDGRKVALARRVQFGRKPKLTQHQLAEGRRRLENGESASSIARDFNCHRAIVVRLRSA
jgi:DNA invertase Pin-like site-specific DNA recombinase